jgi:hypothetical protein
MTENTHAAATERSVAREAAAESDAASADCRRLSLRLDRGMVGRWFDMAGERCQRAPAVGDDYAVGLALELAVVIIAGAVIFARGTRDVRGWCRSLDRHGLG